MSKLPSPTEAQLHKSVAAFLHQAIRPPYWWTTFPAGGGGKTRGGQLKAAGLKAGVPDVLVFAPRVGGSLVIAIELKTKLGRLSAVQVDAHLALREAGVICHVARSVEHVETILANYDVPLRATSGQALRARSLPPGWRAVA